MDDNHDNHDEANRSTLPATRAKHGTGTREERNFLHHAVLFYGVGLLFVIAAGFIWLTAHVLLLVFACVLFAVLLYDLSERVRQGLHLSHGLALGLVVFLLFGLLGLAGWLMAPQITQQVGDLTSTIPHAIDRLRAAAEQRELLRDLVAALPSTQELMSRATKILSQVGVLFTGVLGAVGNFAIIAFVGTYFAAQPHIYIDGIVTLMPRRKRQRAREVIAELGRTLGQWLVGKFVTMVVVGIVTALGLSLLGVPLALVLGIIAGLLDFIPYLGPILAGGPAVLIAFSESPTLALYVALFFLAVQIAEGYLLTPLIERQTVSLPPALTIVMQVLMGALFGLAGVALATPLTAALAVLVTMLYVQDVLGDQVKTPSEH
ncbi:AI-2E family transporter [Noviherbaspirillum saxi]|uniref:AI-2E family transporter n=1 Tax=Noviherbaspirillum saxi TaxID=2320863 RepID=A0A3A3FWN0_9BURK|nr:AI-2E family transporter [Noviherbaspirillum saxi]RJF98571.1 AI-2E family transporter [Noviherbaspirillum saxi]